MINSGSKINHSEMNRILFKKYKNGNLDIRNEIIKNNLELVGRIAHNYSEIDGISYDDLFQEGCIGLIEAIDNYDLSCKKKFEKSASLRIMRCITNYIKRNKYLLKIPGSLVANIYLYDKLKYENLSNEEIRYEMQMSEEEFNEFLNEYNKINYTKFIDLKEKINENEENLMIEDIIIGDENIDVAVDNVFRSELRTKLRTKLKEILTERELQIIYMKFGFDCKEMTSKEVGTIIGVTESRIGQIKHKALAKLRHKSEIGKFNI